MANRSISILRETALLLLFGVLGAVFWGIPFATLMDVFFRFSETTVEGMFVDDPFSDFTILSMVGGVVGGILIRISIRRQESRRSRDGAGVRSLGKLYHVALECVSLIILSILMLRGIGQLFDFTPWPSMSTPWSFTKKAGIIVLGLIGIGSVFTVAATFATRRGRRKFVKDKRPMEDDEFLDSFEVEGPGWDQILNWRRAIGRAAGVDSWFIHPTDRINDFEYCFLTGWNSVEVCMEMEDVLAEVGEGTVIISNDMLDRRFMWWKNPTIGEYITYALSIMVELMEREEKAAAVSP